MAKKNLWLGIQVMALVFGMTVVGCDNDDSKSLDSKLFGTWESQSTRYIFYRNGTYEYYYNSNIINGTWSTHGSIITFTPEDRSSYSYTYIFYDNGKTVNIGDREYYKQ